MAPLNGARLLCKGQWAVEFDDEVYSTDGVNNEQIAMVFSENEVRDAAFIAAANPATVLALLDELEAKDRRIEEEIARANREHHRGFMMACGHLKEHSNVHYADAAEMEIAALRNRINELESAAAGKGGAS
ncbi:ead/Ea22-like family protein [Enterobacter hormaechei subsp. steigerwaltii]|nr:ead/Ea22-like family protein [Enterobacter hormaechei]MCU3959174.1 ead/Ea22-like family protein [Enterobacter hormaechei subsp. steigerwaltii]MDE7651115.1 ead/Ea22-like family protein [Enterobacter hormaechei]